MNMTQLTIQSLAELYRKRETFPVEVTHVLVEEIERENGKLNAYATITAELALEQAHIAEQEMMKGQDRGPLHGVPINLKDNIVIAGIPTKAGSPIMNEYVPVRDAQVVTRLKEAGAILLGKANMMEFAYAETHPSIGITNNPWNLEHTVNGSSSGSAASVAAGLAFGSLGTDTGGSIRIPSSYCGLVGLKPTYNLVSCDGVIPLAWSLDHVGPMTRSVYDNAALLSAISDFQFESDLLSSPSVAGLRIGVLQIGSDVTDEVQSAIMKLTQYLKDQGASIIREVKIPILKDTAKVLMGVMLPEASAAHDELLAEQGGQYHPLIRDRLEIGSLIPAVDYLRAQRFRARFCREVNLAMQNIDVLVLPTTLSSAPRHDESPELDIPVIEALTQLTAPFNVTGLPALALPTGISRSGLPLSMQIVGKPFTESIIYQVAAVCEQVTGCKGQVPSVKRIKNDQS
ncbi:amidase [Aneurinibacillus tyrosinisolvens]|uniref:amidase n=1 Tax=Aneurinibacillus tyrosinisolvens TaxID=1443435 RepID=UPI00069B5617|nr:amidase [Aneurinibacillus tyrosinisolvens]